MKSLKHQGGFLVETVIGLILFLGVVAAFIIPMQLEKQKDEAAESFARDIRYLITRIHQYQHHKVTVEGERAAEAQVTVRAFRAADGTQTSVAKGMVSTYRLSPGESFRKPTCPSGLTPDPVLAIGNLDVEQPYTLVGSVKPYISGETSTHWTVDIEMMVINNTTGSYEKVRKGEIVALAQCK